MIFRLKLAFILLILPNKLMANNPKVQEWWSNCKPCQIPDPNRKKGEWWTVMEEVFHHD